MARIIVTKAFLQKVLAVVEDNAADLRWSIANWDTGCGESLELRSAPKIKDTLPYLSMFTATVKILVRSAVTREELGLSAIEDSARRRELAGENIGKRKPKPREAN